MAEAEAGTGGAEAELSLFFLTAEQAVAEEAEEARRVQDAARLRAVREARHLAALDAQVRRLSTDTPN